MSTVPNPRSIVGHALLLGIAGDALLGTAPGLGLPIWTTLFVLAAMSLAWNAGRVLTGQTCAWLAAAILFSTGAAWRDAELLQVMNAMVTAGALGMAALSLNDPRTALFAPRLRDTIWAGAALLARVVAGIIPIALEETAWPSVRAARIPLIRPILRAAALSGVLLLVFGSLLRADPLFASLVALPRIDLGALIAHGITIGFFAWVVGGWAGGALVARSGRLTAPDALPLSLGVLDITVALGTLTLLFTTFVASQLGWFFGGEQFLRQRTGLTAAEYAREGFFQMVWVVLLVVTMLLATRAALRPGKAAVVRHTVLSLPVIALLGAIIFSAVMRMRLYVHYYGLTLDRFYALVFMLWLAVVVVWLALTVLRGWGRPFAAGAVVSGLAILAALNVLAPDALVARVNIQRAAQAPRGARPPLDLLHLARLSGEAAELTAEAVISAREGETTGRCEAAQLLLDRWGTLSEPAQQVRLAASWRWWNAGRAQAMGTASRRAAELGTLRRLHCRRLEVTSPDTAYRSATASATAPPDSNAGTRRRINTSGGTPTSPDP